MGKTIAEINERIANGQAVVVTAEEVIEIAADKGIKEAAREIDVVTTGTLTDAWPVEPGQVWHTQPGDARLPGLSLRFKA